MQVAAAFLETLVEAKCDTQHVENLVNRSVSIAVTKVLKPRNAIASCIRTQLLMRFLKSPVASFRLRAARPPPQIALFQRVQTCQTFATLKALQLWRQSKCRHEGHYYRGSALRVSGASQGLLRFAQDLIGVVRCCTHDEISNAANIAIGILNAYVRRIHNRKLLCSRHFHIQLRIRTATA